MLSLSADKTKKDGDFDKIVHIYTEISAKQGILCTKSIFYSFLTMNYDTYLIKSGTFAPSKPF